MVCRRPCVSRAGSLLTRKVFARTLLPALVGLLTLPTVISVFSEEACVDDDKAVLARYGGNLGITDCIEGSAAGGCTNPEYEDFMAKACPVTCQLGCGAPEDGVRKEPEAIKEMKTRGRQFNQPGYPTCIPGKQMDPECPNPDDKNAVVKEFGGVKPPPKQPWEDQEIEELDEDEDSQAEEDYQRNLRAEKERKKQKKKKKKDEPSPPPPDNMDAAQGRVDDIYSGKNSLSSEAEAEARQRTATRKAAAAEMAAARKTAATARRGGKGDL